jgi:septal ring factor EnvC (AmiA/AmiB activator)
LLSNSELKRVTDQVRSDSQKTAEQFEKLAQEQNRKMKDLQAAVTRLEDTLATLDVSSRWLLIYTI